MAWQNSHSWFNCPLNCHQVRSLVQSPIMMAPRPSFMSWEFGRTVTPIMRMEFAGIRIELLYYFYNGLAVDRSASRETPTRPSSRESTAEHKIIVSVCCYAVSGYNCLQGFWAHRSVVKGSLIASPMSLSMMLKSSPFLPFILLRRWLALSSRPIIAKLLGYDNMGILFRFQVDD